HNTTSATQKSNLYAAIRPFQVNPPWQFLNTQGGAASIDSISYDGSRVHVNRDRIVLPLTRPSGFGATTFDEGNVVEMLRTSQLPLNRWAKDRLGRSTGILSWDISLRAGGDTTIDVAIPLHEAGPSCQHGASLADCRGSWTSTQLAATQSWWEGKENRVAIKLPSSAADYVKSIHSNLAYILINRDGAGIQPGSRSYERSWIRDGSLTSTALLRLGHYREVRDYINWYATYQFDNGKIPCCVDTRGADPVPENDSQGEFIYLVAEYYRHTLDRDLLEKMWPHVSRTVVFMDSLRHSRMTDEYKTGDKRVFYGLMPQSISHEGYSAKPMHSYWDDFFALRGYKDAADIATILGKPDAKKYADALVEFRKDFYASIQLSMKQHNIDYIPGAAELGDFDATSTTIAINPGDELAHIPQPALNRTFAKYYANFVNRRDSANWDAYTPYEWRTVGAFVRMGEKKKAHEIADFFFNDQRPKAWHQWAEVVYRDSLKTSFIGDMPHTWVGSDFIRSALDMFAFERESDSSLVIGGGIPENWAREEKGVTIRGLSTHYGTLTYSMRAAGKDIQVSIEKGTRVPAGGLVVESPSDRAIKQAVVNGKQATVGKGSIVVRSLPAGITFKY
ncbi:MAG: coagulation factor 5/8 type domain-containing protein, partial [Gemmatimonadales bacterium]